MRCILKSVLFGSLFFSQVAWSNTINHAGIIPFSDHVRLTITADKPLHIKHFTLTHPARMVIDIQESVLTEALKSTSPKTIRNSYIDYIRLGQFDPKTVRFVITLRTNITIRTTAVTPTPSAPIYQVNIDLYPASALPKEKSTTPQTVFTSPTPKPSKTPSYLHKSITPFVIMIDPGHGGTDAGAMGSKNNKEKDVVLAIAEELKKLLVLDPRIKTYLTRDENIFVPLGTRVGLAREHHADIFVSIHADAFTKPGAHGSSVFALSEKGATSKAAELLAKNQNSVDQIIGVSAHEANIHVRHTLLDLTQTATINSSLKLGKYVLNQLKVVNVLHSHRVEQANFAVLKAPDIPSILVETAFISNPEEEERLTNSDFQRKIAKAIFNGIQAYMATLPAYRPSK